MWCLRQALETSALKHVNYPVAVTKPAAGFNCQFKLYYWQDDLSYTILRAILTRAFLEGRENFYLAVETKLKWGKVLSNKATPFYNCEAQRRYISNFDGFGFEKTPAFFNILM